MLHDILVDWLDDKLANLVPVTSGPLYKKSALGVEARYLLVMKTPIAHDPIRVKRALRKLGQVASFKYVSPWPEGYQLYVVMPDKGSTAEQYTLAVKPFCQGSLLMKGQHLAIYSVAWDTSAELEQVWDELPVRDLVVLVLVAVALVLTLRINVGG